MVLRVVEHLHIEVEQDDEHEINNELGQEEVAGVGVPFKVNDDLDCLLIKQVQVLGVLECPD